ncbi:MAG: 5-formyltetrahydrofolate cyclo-ligase [Rhizomicrobium sp.]
MTEGTIPIAPDDLRAWRKSERARLLDLRRNMPAAEHRSASEAIMQTLLARLAPGSQHLIACYWPFRREFNCVPFMRATVRAGGGVALPVVRGRGEPLEFRRWTEDAVMEKGVWNIPHPAEREPVFPTALLIPLVGFDDRGYRLGYGAAYYDLTLAALPGRPLAVGVGFEFSRLPSIHPQPHDRPMDAIVTEAGLRENFAA